MIRTARIVATDIAGATATVQLDDVAACRRCSRGAGCGAQWSATSGSQPLYTVNCAPQLNVKPGQQVTVELDERGSTWLWAVICAYGLPLLSLLMATALGTYLVSPVTSMLEEIVIVGTALTGLAGGVFAWRMLSPKVLAGVERSLCLRSARIVPIQPFR